MAMEPGAVEARIERLEAKFAQQRMFSEGGLGQGAPDDRPETAGIAEAQDHRGGAGGVVGRSQDQVEVIVRARGWCIGIDPQRAGHAEVNQQPADGAVVLQSFHALCATSGAGRRQAFEQQVLATPLDAPDHAPGQPRLQFRLHRPAQAAVTHRHVDNTPPHHVRQQSAPRDFHFRQFRHRPKTSFASSFGLRIRTSCPVRRSNLARTGGARSALCGFPNAMAPRGKQGIVAAGYNASHPFLRPRAPGASISCRTSVRPFRPCARTSFR
ncbi:hypothetical protein D3C87_1174600 [compost metagenome]